MSLSLPGNGYGNTFDDEREKIGQDTHTRVSDIPTDYFGYNSEGPLSKHSTVQRYPEEPTKDVFILAYQDNDAKNTLVNNAYDKLSSEIELK